MRDRPPGALAHPVLPPPIGPAPEPDTVLVLRYDGVTRVPGAPAWRMRDLSAAAQEAARYFDGTETLVLAPIDDPLNWVWQIAAED